MRDILLALSVGAMFLYGFYIMKKVDEFLEEIYFYNHQRIQLKTKLTPLELRSQFVA